MSLNNSAGSAAWRAVSLTMPVLNDALFSELRDLRFVRFQFIAWLRFTLARARKLNEVLKMN